MAASNPSTGTGANTGTTSTAEENFSSSGLDKENLSSLGLDLSHFEEKLSQMKQIIRELPKSEVKNFPDGINFTDNLEELKEVYALTQNAYDALLKEIDELLTLVSVAHTFSKAGDMLANIKTEQNDYYDHDASYYEVSNAVGDDYYGNSDYLEDRPRKRKKKNKKVKEKLKVRVKKEEDGQEFHDFIDDDSENDSSADEFEKKKKRRKRRTFVQRP